MMRIRQALYTSYCMDVQSGYKCQHILATATIMLITVLCYAARINISYYITFLFNLRH